MQMEFLVQLPTPLAIVAREISYQRTLISECQQMLL